MTVDQVKKRIKLMGLKKTFVAEKIEVHQTTLSHYLNGKRDLEPLAKERLRNYLRL